MHSIVLYTLNGSMLLYTLNGWMASLMQWTWTWANSRRWWGTRRAGVLQSMGCKELDMTEWLNNNKSNTQYFSYFPRFVCSIASCSSSHLPPGLIFLLPEWTFVGTELFQFSFVWKWLFPFNYWYAAATKSLQSCPTLCDPIDGSPLGPSVPGTLQARTLECVEFLI